MQQCLSLYHRAVARLRRDCKDPTTLKAMACDGMRWHAMAMFETDTDSTGLGKGHTVTYMSCLGDFEDHLEVFVGDEIPNGGCSIQKNHPLSLKVPSLAARVSN